MPRFSSYLLLMVVESLLIHQAHATTMSFARASTGEFFGSATVATNSCDHSGTTGAGCQSSLTERAVGATASSNSSASLGLGYFVGGFYYVPPYLADANVAATSTYYTVFGYSFYTSASAYLDMDAAVTGAQGTGYLQYECPNHSWGFANGNSCTVSLGSAVTGPTTIYGDQYLPFTYGAPFTFHVDAGAAGTSEDTLQGGSGGSATLKKIAVYANDFSLLKTFTSAPAGGQFDVSEFVSSGIPEPSVAWLIVPLSLALMAIQFRAKKVGGAGGNRTPE